MVKTTSEKYQKLDQREHILRRPDTYVGSLAKETQTCHVVASGRFRPKEIRYSPAAYKIFDEIVVNALDHSVNDDSVTQIKIDIDESNAVSVYNNGTGIPVEMHTSEQVYVPELIFGHFLTSSNYDDSERRVTGGRNGYGAKLTNVFSKEFTVETVDAVQKKLYRQTFRENLSITDRPIIKSCSNRPYTRITFLPDYERLKTTMTKDLRALFKKRAYDLVACTRPTIQVYFDGEKLPCRTFSKYCELYDGVGKIVFEKLNDDWDLGCAVSSDGFRQVSFVNGVTTAAGGTHVDHVARQIVAKLIEKLKKGTPGVIRNYLFLFLRATVVNPSFGSQTKDKLTSKVSDFGYKVVVSDRFVASFLKKTTIRESVDAMIRFKELAGLKKATDGSKKNVIRGIPKLDDATWAGTPRSQRCTLILTEGESAKTFAISGVSVIGREQYGVYPLKGKMLNVRDATPAQLVNNKELKELKQILGLKQDTIYRDTKQLRYGSVMLLTDGDVDGSHIKGLGMNMFHHFWKELLQIPGFVKGFYTPIVCVSKGSQLLQFYTLKDFEQWKSGVSGLSAWKTKYYKGLGTSTAAEAKSYFRKLSDHQIEYRFDGGEQDDECMSLAFDKRRADDRKQWISSYDPDATIEWSQKTVDFCDFIHRDLIHFSVYDNERSIPSACDGLKVSQRKILWSCFRRKLYHDTSEIKVAQLSGYISEKSGYHHGEVSLQGAIVNMAQDYVGSNNINLLDPQGQFGTRVQNGKDHASARYIFTKLTDVAQSLFPACDSDLLAHEVDDDGGSVEPCYYLPTLPLVLVNGADGIGTGYSTYIPNFDPDQIRDYLRARLENKPYDRPFLPWYRGFRGTVESADSDGRYNVFGRFERLSPTKLKITELPVGKGRANRSFSQYKEFLEKSDFVSSFDPGYTDEAAEFTVTTVDDLPADDAEVFELFALVNVININNMHLFDNKKRIRKFASAKEIIDFFYELRIELYERRQSHLVDIYTAETGVLRNKMRFLREIMGDTLVVYRQSKATIDRLLGERGYDPSPDGTYSYLTEMRIHSFTEENLSKLAAKLIASERLLAETSETTPVAMYLSDL